MSQYNTSFWLLLKMSVLELYVLKVASVLLTTNLTPFSGLELVFTDVLIWNKFVPYMTHLQAQKSLAPFHWWFTCKLAGNGIKRLRLGAEASKQLILKTRLWLTYSSRGRQTREDGNYQQVEWGKQERIWGKNGCRPSWIHKTTSVHIIVYFIWYETLTQQTPTFIAGWLQIKR